MLTIDDAARQLADESHCMKFLKTWLAWRGDSIVPGRNNVRPEDLRAELSAITVLEFEADDRVMVRVSSSESTERTGINRKGVNIVDLASPQDRDERIRRLNNMVTVPCGSLSDTVLTLKTGRKSTLRSLSLPVTGSPASKSRLVYVASDFLDPPDDLRVDLKADIPLAHRFQYIDIGAGAPE